MGGNSKWGNEWWISEVILLLIYFLFVYYKETIFTHAEWCVWHGEVPDTMKAFKD